MQSQDEFDNEFRQLKDALCRYIYTYLYIILYVVCALTADRPVGLLVVTLDEGKNEDEEGEAAMYKRQRLVEIQLYVPIKQKISSEFVAIGGFLM